MASWERALAADPRHVRARCERANWAQSFGAITAEFAVQECRRALADDPLNAWVGGMLAMVLGHAGRHEDALASARAAVAVDPDSFFPNWTLLRELVWFRDLDAAFALAKRLLASSDRHSWAMGMLGWAHERAGEPARSRAVFDELEARSRHEFVSPLWLAMTASFAGADDDAIRFLARAAAEREPLVLLVKLFPFGDRLRADPRFEETVRGVWG
jgi:predicted Zn-dependent protease